MAIGGKDSPQGALTLLVLRTLEARGPLHGYGLCIHIQSVSEELLRIEEGSLYPALHRMEQEGWLESSWQRSEKGRRAKFYQITDHGRDELERQKAGWERLARGVALVLQPVD